KPSNKSEETEMRYMMIVKANEESEAGSPPSSEGIAAMGRYNEQLIAAGILLAADGLHPTKNGSRIKFEGGKPPKVTDGPFTETKELVAGFWVIDVKSKDEALEWARRIPFADGEEVELRKVFEASDFAVDSVTEEHLAKEAAWREANQKPIRN
ncbi:MAG: YciI family protein, partial [Devosia sp.]